MSTTDPVVRYLAAGILLAVGIGAMAIVVHGYWQDGAYQPPALISWTLGAIVTGAAGTLGWHVGAQTTSAGFSQGVTTVKEAQNGKVEGQ